MRVLVTGFEPFGGDDENASGTAVQALHGRPGVVTALLPVEFGASGDLLAALVAQHRPDHVVCVGEAGGRAKVSIETLAHNLDDARIPDNAGAQPRGVPIRPGSPATLAPRWDASASYDAVAATGVPVELSTDAGRFVCNHVFFRSLEELDVPAIFVHVPAVRSHGTAGVGAETDAVGEVGDLPTMADLVRALEAVVRQLALSGHPA